MLHDVFWIFRPRGYSSHLVLVYEYIFRIDRVQFNCRAAFVLQENFQQW